MKNTLLFCLITLLFYHSAYAQWYPDTPTPAEMQARDLPYHVLQAMITKTLTNNIWGMDAFGYIKESPEETIMLRGGGIHNFSVSGWKDECKITLKEGSPQLNFMKDSEKVISARMTEAMTDGYQLGMQAMKNAGKMSKEDHARIRQDSIVNIQSSAALAHLHNQRLYASITLKINAESSADLQTGGESYFANTVQTLHVSGVKQAVLCIEYPDKKRPNISPDTSYWASIYIGNWKQPDYKNVVEYPFKYNTKTAWLDKAHSGLPIIENFRITIYSIHYNQIMNTIKSIDWTKLEALVKK